MNELYDIYFAAQLIDGFDEASVRANVGSLFKADAATLEKLFSGKPQLIKRGVDKPGAIKYKAALQKAGAIALIRKQSGTTAAAPNAPQAAASAAPGEEEYPSSSAIKATKVAAGTMAERVAAMAAASDAAEQSAALAAQAAKTDTSEGGLSLAPVGSSLLDKQHRTQIVEALNIDTSSIQLAVNVGNIEHLAESPAPPAPDIDHLSMGEVGEDIPHLESTAVPLNPDTSHLSMGEVGEDIPHLESNAQPLNPDTSALQLSPEGSDVLDPAERRKESATAPNTDHLSLEQ